MDLIELEAIAVETYQRLDLDPARPVSTFRVAREMLQDGHAITRPPTLLGRYPACIYHVEGRPKIALRRTIPDDEQQFYVGHELAHLLLGKPHGSGHEIEAACNYLGAALMAPRPAVFALYKSFGWNVSQIAKKVVATQTWAALRLGEAMLVPLATVGPIAVRVRGPEEWCWPDERTIVEWARGTPGFGLKKIRVTDRTRRTIITAS